LSVFSRNAWASQEHARAEYDNRAIVNQPDKAIRHGVADPFASSVRCRTANALAERRQRCDKAAARPHNDPKLNGISNLLSGMMIFGDLQDCEVCMTE